MKRNAVMMALGALVAVAGVATAYTLSQQSITIKGSDTMLILNQRWAEAYGRVNSRVSVSVTGGGSSIGINALINGVTDICASSRPMRKSEVDRAQPRRGGQRNPRRAGWTGGLRERVEPRREPDDGSAAPNWG